MMPDMTGFEVCRRLKESPETKHIPVILVTALNRKEDLVRGLDSGADEFVTKPVNGPELRARTRSMLRIKRLYDELQETIHMREQLADMIVHDMRSPLYTVMLYSDLLEKRNGADEQAQQLTGKIRAQAHRLNSMLTDMLLLAKRKAGKLVLDRVSVDMNHMIMEAVQDQTVVAKSEGIDVQVELPPSGQRFLADGKLLQRTVDNLLSNAIKFSSNSSTVVVKLTYIGNRSGLDASVSGFRITVADEGVGIPEDKLESIFEQYEIAEAGGRDVEQTGLGLAFCKMVVEAHGGRIVARPNEPRGSVFTIEI
jgi:signal transduction histidine kinase